MKLYLRFFERIIAADDTAIIASARSSQAPVGTLSLFTGSVLSEAAAVLAEVVLAAVEAAEVVFEEAVEAVPAAV